MLTIENQINGFLRFPSCADDESFVILQYFEPVLNISGAVAEAARGFKPTVINQRYTTDLSHKLFL